MNAARALVASLLDAIRGDEELRTQLRELLVPIVGEALSTSLAADFVDRHEAERMGIGWKSLRGSELPCFRVGRKNVYRRADVVAFVERERAASPPASPPGERTSESRLSSPPESGDSFEVALQRAEKRRRATG